NAVLRGLVREGGFDAPPEVNAPDWLVQRWRTNFGEAAAAGVAAAGVAEPATDPTPRDPSKAEALAAALEAEVLRGGSLRTRRKGDVAGWPGFVDGTWWVQDAAAAVPARLLDVKPGESAVDLCAAPGGKTLQLAATGATVIAIDRSAGRLKRL